MPLNALAHWALARPGGPALVLGLLFLSACLVLSLGIWEPTGVTGKDEYYLGLRTPMCMLERDTWLIPCLDDEPRLRKPPLVYWLTRGSYELFGVSLTSARLVAVGMGALLVLGIGLIGRELTGDLATGLRAGLVGLSFLGLAIGGRMLELDIPVAMFSTLAFHALLRWYHGGGWVALTLGALALAAGFLTKGPVVLVVCGGGGLALLASDPGARAFLARHWRQALGAVLLFLALSLPWFAYVQYLLPEHSLRTLATELDARKFMEISPVPLYGILLLALPWSFLLLSLSFGLGPLPEERRRHLRMALLWLGLTLLPFFFLKTFERYLYGSLVPLALVLGLVLASPLGGGRRWGIRLGMLLAAIASLPLLAGAAWLGNAWLTTALGLAALAGFVWHGWRARCPDRMSGAAVLLWACLLGLVYPRLGINEIPPRLLELTRQQPVVFFHGPQPGLLPAVLGRSLRLVDGRWRLPEELTQPCARFLLLTEATASGLAVQGLERLGFQAGPPEYFGVLSARVNWFRMAAPGVSSGSLWEALKRRDLEALKPQIALYRVENRACPGPGP